MFKVGEIVVCTNAKRRWFKLGGLKKNEMYTIKGFNPHDGGLILKEVRSPGSGFSAYAANRFRKVDYDFANNVLVELKVQQQSAAEPEKQPEIQLEEYDFSLFD